jgi:HAD superfamily hydrolase (TIGR01549 family)
MSCKAVIFDYIGTLVNCKGYTMEASRVKLHRTLVAEGFNVSEAKFLAAYNLAHEKYRKIRYEQFKEITNAVWVREALSNLGFEVALNDPRINTALNVFFQDFIDTLELRSGARKLLKQTQQQCKVGLISNFTHAPVIYKSLRKVGINRFFNAVVVSEENGWRKPSAQIFQDALNQLHVKCHEAIYVGDSPVEDIKGAKQAGMRTVFVPSQFSTLKDLLESKQEPDCIAKDLAHVSKNLNKIVSLEQ